jgi:hypothetical protein
MRIAHKQKKHEMFLRKQLLDDLHKELVQGIVEPLRVWTGAMLIMNRNVFLCVTTLFEFAESGLLQHSNTCGGSRR